MIRQFRKESYWSPSSENGSLCCVHIVKALRSPVERVISPQLGSPEIRLRPAPQLPSSSASTAAQAASISLRDPQPPSAHSHPFPTHQGRRLLELRDRSCCSVSVTFQKGRTNRARNLACRARQAGTSPAPPHTPAPPHPAAAFPLSSPPGGKHLYKTSASSSLPHNPVQFPITQRSHPVLLSHEPLSPRLFEDRAHIHFCTPSQIASGPGKHFKTQT